MNYLNIRRPRHPAVNRCTNIAIGSFCAFVLLHASNAPASAASLSRSVNVDAPASAVWSAIGPFCAIKDWHPVIGSCAIDGANPLVRTLVTKDGKAKFVEPQVARNDAERFYSYTFTSSPFPVTHYIGTIWVVPNGANGSTVLWTGTYTPLPGKEKAADAAFAGVYDSGLGAIKAKFEQHPTY